MRRDSIFYQLFRQSPSLLFELIPNPPDNAQDYRFDSVAVKEPKFEIDGVFLPPTGIAGTIFICEVQFQKDELLYERIYAETFPYFYQNRTQFSDWQIVVIYPSRKTEQKDTYPFRSSIENGQIYRVYLDELGDIRQLPPWLALMVLTITDEAEAPTEARHLLGRARAEVSPEATRAIIEMVATIISYKFDQLSREDVEKMLDIKFEETRVFREIQEDALQQGLQQGLQEGRQEGRQEGAAALVLR
ncbi:MAG: Rpn family recombination-promoting nuclease/putative transposase, partial [Cyanobacteria bacterium J06555_13]